MSYLTLVNQSLGFAAGVGVTSTVLLGKTPWLLMLGLPVVLWFGVWALSEKRVLPTRLSATFLHMIARLA